MDNKDTLINELRALVAKQAAQLKRQAAQLERQAAQLGRQAVELEKQAAEIAELKIKLAKALKDSSTSSKPPSSDITKPKPKKKPGRPSKPRRGGQPGHEQHLRQPLPEDRVNETLDYEINDADIQRWGLTATGEYHTIQHIELAELPTVVTNHRLAVYRDAAGNLYLPDVPEFYLTRPRRTHFCGS